MEYNTGNYDKYLTRNPLKRKLVSRLNDKILLLVRDAAEKCWDARLTGDSRTGEHAAQKRKISILDAGCGEGFVAGFILSEIGGERVDITGLELTDEALRIARSMNPEIPFVQGDVTAMPFASRSFDIVLCTEVLEHLNDPSAALHELLRVTKGALILTVPHEPWFCLGNLLVLKNVTRLGNPIDHVNHWSFSAFSAFLKDNSYENWKMDRSFPWSVAYCCVNRDETP